MISRLRHLWGRPRPTRVEQVSHSGVPNWFPYPRNEDVVEVDFLRVHWNSPLGPSRAGRAAETAMIPMVVVRVQGPPWTSTLQVGVCVSFNTSFLLLQGSYHVYQPLKYLQIQRRSYLKVWPPPGLLMIESCNRLVEASGDERTKTPDRGLGGKEVWRRSECNVGMHNSE